MSDTYEPLAAILAEFRAFAMRAADEDKTISPESILLLADKVEAAAERERRKYESLHECFWSDAAIQNIVRQLLDERNDLRNQNPKASEVAAHFAQLLEKAATRSPGNAAALRSALAKFLDLSRRGLAFFTSYRYTEAENTEIEDAFDEAKAALYAPARNCDRFATELDARLAWKRETKCKGDYRYWLFAPAKGGDHA